MMRSDVKASLSDDGSNNTELSETDAANENGIELGPMYPLDIDIDMEDEDSSLELTGPLLPQLDDKIKPQVYPQRWIQLSYLSMLALLSDWICFSTAASPETFETSYGHSSASLIDIFLFMNVASCFCVTDVVEKYGLQRCIKMASLLMALGAWLRSGLGIIRTITDFLGVESGVVMESPVFGLVSYPMFVAGTLMVGAAQPFFQCTPPLLSAHWFASDERAKSTAIALNFNQIGIATAFLIGGEMGNTLDGLLDYFSLIAVLCTILSAGTFLHFQNLPPIPPSRDRMEKLQKGDSEPPFRRSVYMFFHTKGFIRVFAAFICSISITNIVGAFIEEVMERGGITRHISVALAGGAFEVAIVIGGIVLGGYVDRTKAYKKVTLSCLVLSVIFTIPLGLTEHALGKEPVLLVLSLIGLGFVTGPIQPINAELAVDISYPGDETAVESVQQIGGNLFSALIIPLAERAGKLDIQILPKNPLLASDIRGDVILMITVTLMTYCFFSGFDAPLRRTLADQH